MYLNISLVLLRTILYIAQINKHKPFEALYNFYDYP